MTKADLTSRLGYRIDGGASSEVEGVCRFDESSVACWNGEGRNAPDLAARIVQGLNQRPGEGNLQIRYGMKNRILVVRQTTMPMMNGQGDRRSLSLMNVGQDARYGSGSYIPMPEERSDWKPGVPQVRYEARGFAAEKTAKETSLRLMLTEPMPQAVSLALTPGAKTSLAGCTFTVASIAPADPSRVGWMGGQRAGKTWVVTLRQTGTPDRPASFYPRADRILYLDKTGKVIDQKAYGDWMQKRVATLEKTNRPIDFSDSPYRQLQMSTMSLSRGEMQIAMNVDPKTIGRIEISGSYQKAIDVTGIPLDPR